MRKIGAIGIAIIMIISGMGLLGGAIMAKPDKKDMHGNATSFANDNGFDKWGYNQNANLFSGLYCNWALHKFIEVNHEDDDETNDIGPAHSAAETQSLIDAALANGDITQSEYNTVNYYNSYNLYDWGNTYLIMKWNDDWPDVSGGWTTNHMTDTYVGADNKDHKWVYFTKMVKVPSTAYLSGAYWYSADGTEIGPAIWGGFATIESIYNDPYSGFHGVEYLSDYAAGYGAYKE
jgi:hypothetical protein